MPQRTQVESQQQLVRLLDTNVLLRYLVGDDPPKSARATALMQRVERAQEIVEVSESVLTETVWASRNEIGQKLTTVLSLPGLRVGGRAILLLALHNFANSGADFVDCILAAESRLRKLRVYTFDETDFKKLRVDWESP